MMHLRFAAFAAATLLACSAASAAEVQGRVLTGAEIEAEIIGNTVSGTTQDGYRYAEYYRPDGIVRADDYQGKWWIAGDTMCFDYQGADSDGCWGVALDGQKITWLLNGEPDGEARLQAGNPRDF